MTANRKVAFCPVRTVFSEKFEIMKVQDNIKSEKQITLHLMNQEVYDIFCPVLWLKLQNLEGCNLLNSTHFHVPVSCRKTTSEKT